MRCVILSAGMGMRMRPLTNDMPKTLLMVNGKPIIDYILETVEPFVDEFIIVIGYRGKKIERYVGKKYKGKKVRYVKTTGSVLGNAYSFLASEKYLKNERFLLVYSDEIPDSENIKKCLEKDLSVLNYRSRGKWTKDGIMVLNTDIFKYAPRMEDGEYKIDTLIDDFVSDYIVDIIKAKNFIGEINTPEDIERVERKLNG